ncbi:MAG: hypothetical protein POELPBGB_03984 [Bacteroidia bacterium]|nr:hypothetical protein [Bacteroidia bacterium]
MAAERERYRVLTEELNWPADPAVVARLLAGETIPMAERGEIRTARRGELVSDVPAGSVGWLVEQGLIEPVAAAAARKGGDAR